MTQPSFDPDPRLVAKALVSLVLLHGMLTRTDLVMARDEEHAKTLDKGDDELMARAERIAEKLLKRAGL